MSQRFQTVSKLYGPGSVDDVTTLTAIFSDSQMLPIARPGNHHKLRMKVSVCN